MKDRLSDEMLSLIDVLRLKIIFMEPNQQKADKRMLTDLQPVEEMSEQNLTRCQLILRLKLLLIIIN